MKIVKSLLFSLLILFLFSYCLVTITVVSIDNIAFKSNFIKEVLDDKKISLELYTNFKRHYLNYNLEPENETENEIVFALKRAVYKTFDENFVKSIYISMFDQYREFIINGDETFVLKFSLVDQKEKIKVNLKIELKNISTNTFSDEEIDKQVDILFKTKNFEKKYYISDINTKNINKFIHILRLIKNSYYIVSVVIFGSVFALMLLFKKMSKAIMWFGSTCLSSSIVASSLFLLLKEAVIIMELENANLAEVISFSLITKTIDCGLNVSIISMFISIAIIISGFFFKKFGGLKNETIQ